MSIQQEAAEAAETSGTSVPVEREPARKPYVYREGAVVPPDVTNVVVHKSVRVLPREAFAGRRKLEEVDLPPGLQVIGANAFYDCRSLRSVNIPSSVVVVGAYAFAGCRALRRLPLAEGSARYIGKNAFLCCDKLERLDLPASASSIGTNVFYVCSELREVTVKPGMLTIEEGTFRDCPSLKRVKIPSPALVVQKADRRAEREFDCRLVTSGSMSRYETEGVSIISLESLVSISDVMAEVQGEINSIMNRHRRLRREVPAIHALISQDDESRREEDLEAVRKLITRRAALEVSTLLELALWKDRLGREGGGSDSDVEASRGRCRVKCGADEIIPNVLSFL